ncbi:MAG: hypothetical protein IKO48_03305 [Elusimicrobia bacterium]|jgi:hypothetical protein|nr:hypothetical protein [Elusimicrobiota bacterium]
MDIIPDLIRDPVVADISNLDENLLSPQKKTDAVLCQQTLHPFSFLILKLIEYTYYETRNKLFGIF